MLGPLARYDDVEATVGRSEADRDPRVDIPDRFSLEEAVPASVFGSSSEITATRRAGKACLRRAFCTNAN
ncbi:hypothetical protein [uncultured Ilumatobacter sp.]|uniref:hypothetical protein n=1 Tax=uncultured Ilumatobacter sp. TaxID=879968 RepID=UPI00374EEF0F